jgi:hypothetical protein
LPTFGRPTIPQLNPIQYTSPQPRMARLATMDPFGSLVLDAYLIFGACDLGFAYFFVP